MEMDKVQRTLEELAKRMFPNRPYHAELFFVSIHDPVFLSPSEK